jgi:hypothetical protein
MDNLVQKEHKANKIFYIVIFSLIFVSILVTFFKIVLLKDYQIVAQVSCDPTTEKCFVSVCDPDTDDSCSAASSIAERTTYYKKISKKAANIAACEASDFKAGCTGELSCLSGEKDCSYTLCDSSKLSEDEKCSE